MNIVRAVGFSKKINIQPHPTNEKKKRFYWLTHKIYDYVND